MKGKVIRLVSAMGLIAALAVIGFVSCDKGTPMDPRDWVHTESGFISGPGEEDEFSLDTEYTSLKLTFYFSDVWDPYCKIYGMNHNPLGEFRLSDGNVIQLTGGGLFYVAVGSYAGGGHWRCEYRE
jgi:hypothetical protein